MSVWESATVHAVAIIPAAGLGTRLSAGDDGAVPKALRLIAGRSLLQRSVDLLSPFADEIVVALPPDLTATPLESPHATVRYVSGGSTRQRSVANALADVSDDVEWVLVHDAARALVPPAVVRRVLAALHDGAACVVPAIAPADSLRRVAPDGVNAPLARSSVRLVQTPQGFTAAALRRGHEQALDDAATDDASLAEAAGATVTLVDGDPLAFKITHPLDLALAEALLTESRSGPAPH